MKITEIKEGDLFRCTKNVIMKATSTIAYKEGELYKCELDSCITDEGGDKSHGWNLSVDEWPYGETVNDYFEKIDAKIESGSEIMDEIVVTGKDAEEVIKYFKRILLKADSFRKAYVNPGRKSVELGTASNPVDTNPTPGPWYAVEYGGYINLQPTPNYSLLNLLDREQCASAEANGKLAAAAPALLEFAKLAIKMIDESVVVGDILYIKEKAEEVIKSIGL